MSLQRNMWKSARPGIHQDDPPIWSRGPLLSHIWFYDSLGFILRFSTSASRAASCDSLIWFTILLTWYPTVAASLYHPSRREWLCISCLNFWTSHLFGFFITVHHLSAYSMLISYFSMRWTSYLGSILWIDPCLPLLPHLPFSLPCSLAPATRAPASAFNMPSLLLPQDLCTCCFQCLGCSSPSPSHKWLHLL